MIRTENLNKTFKQGMKGVHAVRRVSLEVKKGERVSVHGPSGAGKSTLLHMLGGLSRPSSGMVIFEGESLYHLTDRKRSSIRNRCFGFIFQFYHLLPELNVLENVMLPARIMRAESTRKINSRALGILENVGMDQRLRHRPSQLSGGEAQRVAIARALMNAPEVLFCDEPAGNLDSEMSADIYRLIRRISEENNMSVIVVSHQGTAEGFSHREYFMKDGVLESEVPLEIGTAEIGTAPIFQSKQGKK